MKKIAVGLIGFGTVGAGVVKILREKKSFLSEKIGVEIEVRKICDKDTTTKRPVTVDAGALTKNVHEVIDNPQIDVVVELIGGIHPAKEFITGALNKGKNVVTANKALLSQEGAELFALAADRGKGIYFEASVGAGIPIIKSLREGLVANKFDRVFGIVNGTSNFVLSEMSQTNCTFQDALRRARVKGYAEADPSLDIDGIDSAHKLALLVYLCFGRFVSMKDIFIEGISRVSLDDVNYARQLGYAIKLLAIAKKDGDELEVRVHPTLISEQHLLASVSGVCNAIYVSSDLAGELLFYGPGAGQLSAASAVVSDLVDLTQDIKAGLFRPTMKTVQDTSVKRLRPIDDIQGRYYVRLMTDDKPGVLAKIAGVLAKYSISIASVTQKEKRKNNQAVPIVMVIHEAKEKNIRQALKIIDRFDVMKEKSVAIRIEEA